MIRRLLAFLRDDRGAVIIETAIVAPVLALMGLGAFQVSQLVARQHELQTGADDAASMALAGWDTGTGDVTAMKEVLKRTLELDDSQVTITRKYRCDSQVLYVDDVVICDPDAIVTTYLNIRLTDTYTPMWADFGVGEPFNYVVERTVLVS
ncbi:MAG: pilus assembly protein [Novosphingobium sp.]|nr:pilus assembly protein [Novosphingobium sp.]